MLTEQAPQGSRNACHAHRDLSGRARLDGGGDGDADRDRGARRPRALPVGVRLLPARGDRDGTRFRQALRHLRQETRVPRWHLPLPGRQRARRHLAEHGGPDPLPDPAGSRGRGRAARGHNHSGGHLRARGAGADPGSLRGGVGYLGRRWPRRRRLHYGA